MQRDGSVYFCEGCPRQGECEGPIEDVGQQNVDAAYFSISDNPSGVEVSLGTFFHDTEGGKSEWFPPEPFSTIEDVAACNGLVVVARQGLLRRPITDCGAGDAAAHKFRVQIWGNPEGRPPKRR